MNETTKSIIELVTSVSVGAVVRNIIRHTTPYMASPMERLATGIGGLIITGVASDFCSEYLETKIEEALKEKK